MAGTDKERRKHTRITFISPVMFTSQNRCIEGRLIDLSLKGALVSMDLHHRLTLGENGSMYIMLDEAECYIDIDVQVRHVDDDKIGMAFNSMDLDSITHLTRLIELNLGSHELLERELSGLIEGL